jgi:NAD(P)-dependent dehydrogenase (short-subunit alcohol dehydrogenase family)
VALTDDMSECIDKVVMMTGTAGNLGAATADAFAAGAAKLALVDCESDHGPWVLPASLADVMVFLGSGSSGAISGAAIQALGHS